MTAVRQPALIELDMRSSEPQKPYGIITVDCSSPYEYDDGIAVSRITDASGELYNVSIFAVDTSRYYLDEEIAKQVLRKRESRYNDLETGEQDYDPMLDDNLTQSIHFIKGSVRKAMFLSFVVGQDHPPSDVEVGFGNVEVTRNFSYAEFSRKARVRGTYKPHKKAASYIVQHLSPSAIRNEDTLFKDPLLIPNAMATRKGAAVNSAFMIGGGHLIAKQLRDEKHLAIYRVHDVDDMTASDFLSPRMARFSLKPGPHHALGIDPYLRPFSPLRRAEDFIMLGILRARYEGRTIGTRDLKLAKAAVQCLNQAIINQLPADELRLGAVDLGLSTGRRSRANLRAVS